MISTFHCPSKQIFSLWEYPRFYCGDAGFLLFKECPCSFDLFSSLRSVAPYLAIFILFDFKSLSSSSATNILEFTFIWNLLARTLDATQPLFLSNYNVKYIFQLWFAIANMSDWAKLHRKIWLIIGYFWTAHLSDLCCCNVLTSLLVRPKEWVDEL